MIQNIKLGRAVIEPKGPVEAGAYVTITFTYTVEHPIDDSGYIKICFRAQGDFGQPQFASPVAPNYCTVRTTGNCHTQPRWDTKGHTRPWSRALFLRLERGYLDRGEKVIVVFGDTSGGSPGWQMQTFLEDNFEFKTFVDPIATYEFKELPTSPVLRIVAGKPFRALTIAPSEVRANEPFTYYLKIEDRWGNPVKKPASLHHPGFTEMGIKIVLATDKRMGLSAESNPIQVISKKTLLHPFWADFHGQSEETIGTSTIEDYFNFARDFGILDIAAHQGNDFQISDEFWGKVNKISSEYYAPGKFVTFPGYEWSGNTPLGGDRNVFFLTEDGRISHSATDLLPDKSTAFDVSPTAGDLFRDLRKQAIKSFAFAHVGGRYADMKMHDQLVEIAVEVHSSWGTFEWLVDEALRRGYRIGIVANSDDHKCRPGACYPGSGQFGSLGGLTCVLAKSLDRENVFRALKARHFYATTGNRCLMDVSIITGNGNKGVMGDVVSNPSGTPTLYVRVVGPSPVESVDVRNGLNTIKTFRPYDASDLGRKIKLVWSGAEVPGRDRLTRWDGNLMVRDNTITLATAVNFWNANQPLRQIGQNQLSWQSNTTGGLSGIIMELEKPDSGFLDIATLQGKFSKDVKSIGFEPAVIDYGGLKKRIELYRLPAKSGVREFSFSLELNDLHGGDNPVYIRTVQEDGHMAWSSPIYLVQK